MHNLANYYLEGFNQDGIIWHVNINRGDVLKLPISKSFWEDVLQCWSNLNFHDPQSTANIRKQLLNGNLHIRIADKPIWLNMESKDTWLTIDDVFDLEKRCFKTFNEFQEIHSKTDLNWFSYHAIITAIPKYWKCAVFDEDLTDQHTDMTGLLSSKTLTRMAYTMLNDKNNALTSSAKSWHNLLQDNFEWDTHVRAFKNMYKITNIVKLRSFQYRLLHNKIFCNNALFHWKIKDTQLCEHGCNEKEDIKHLLFNCRFIKPIWEEIETFSHQKNMQVEISFANIVYNLIHPKPKHIANFITLVIKQYIYRCKCEGYRPSTQRAKIEIYDNMYIEKYNATVDMKLY